MAEWETNQNDDDDSLRIQLRAGSQDVNLGALAPSAIRWHIRNRSTGTITSFDTTTIDDAATGKVTLSAAGKVAVAGLFDIIVRVTFAGGTQKSWPIQKGTPYVWEIHEAFA